MFKTHIFSPENRAVYEIMCKNMIQPDRPYMVTWSMRFASWISKATDTLSEYVTLTDFPQQ